jgi:hypothetical protein
VAKTAVNEVLTVIISLHQKKTKKENLIQLNFIREKMIESDSPSLRIKLFNIKTGKRLK